MARVTVYALKEGTSPRWAEAFAAGCGGRVERSEAPASGPIALFGSPDGALQAAQAEGRTWYYGDHAYFGRGTFYRCTRNAKQHDGRGEFDPARWRAHKIPIRDWRSNVARGGGHILLCPNSEYFLGLHGYKPGQWVEETTAELKRHTDRPIRLRWKTDGKERPFTQELPGCWALVTFMSNTAVEAIVAGVPAICTHACAGLTMGTDDLGLIENPPMPEGREAWCAALAANQWTLAEMRRGDLWRAIGEK